MNRDEGAFRLSEVWGSVIPAKSPIAADKNNGKKKKSKESKNKVDLLKSQSHADSGEDSSEDVKLQEVQMKTNAEVMFQRAQAKKQEKELLKIASTTHKDKILKFNENLDKLTEHFDIPKVSWTKGPSEEEGESFTKAQKLHMAARNIKQEGRILDLCTTSHREKMMRFNESLDKLTEHNDIPNVGWTNR